MMEARAWMLRQDGKEFPCAVHLYASQEEDLSSVAEVSSFLIATKSKDIDLANKALGFWMALLIEEVVSYDADAARFEAAISEEIKHLPYKFPYPVSNSDLIEIWRQTAERYNIVDINSFYDFIDEEVRPNIEAISTQVAGSLNQQFCRVRYGGQYDTRGGNSEIWFRISSVGFNWANTIYLFVADHKRSLHLSYISICRDYESDHGNDLSHDDYFYKAKDGSVYYHMPIEEYYAEEHEHSPVFSAKELNWNRGVVATIRSELQRGSTVREVIAAGLKAGIVVPGTVFARIGISEYDNVVKASQLVEELPTDTRRKLGKVTAKICDTFPDIINVSYELSKRENTKDKEVGFQLMCTLTSPEPDIDGLQIEIRFTRPLDQITPDILFRSFRIEYTDYLKYRNSNKD